MGSKWESENIFYNIHKSIFIHENLFSINVALQMVTETDQTSGKCVGVRKKRKKKDKVRDYIVNRVLQLLWNTQLHMIKLFQSCPSFNKEEQKNVAVCLGNHTVCYGANLSWLKEVASERALEKQTTQPASLFRLR